MATMKLAVLAAACACAFAFPQEPTGPATKNTIFVEETFEGEAFENMNFMDQLMRNDNSSLYRLPNTTAPSHYDVLWQINIQTLQMSGSVEITFHATREYVNEVVMHSHELTITQATLSLGATPVPILPIVLEPERRFLRVPLNGSSLIYNATAPVAYTLYIVFNAPLRTDMYGIYQSWFKDIPTQDNVSWMASTQFQATAGRSAFPCYDEPSFKATFIITIRRPTGFRSWSCTRIANTVNSTVAGYQEDIYHQTPIMSTYLLAIIVAQYDSNEVFANNQLTYEVIARPNAMNDTIYALEVGQELLAEMSRHTDIDFYSVNPNLKMTQAAIPDFGAGAMENWGLLTYREAYLLYDEANTDSQFKQLIAYILSHEIAHMWFGNLVTNDWWDVLWLNEGFARYYQYFLTHWVEDHMGFETRFIIEQVHTSLLSDSANNPHPLSTTSIGSPASVSGMFSTISYNKGAAVIRMTEHLLGFSVHEEGLRNYLKQHQFRTTLPIDLFEALQNVSIVRGAIAQYGPEFSVIDYYKTWTEQPGHPVLNVQVNHQTGEMIISQRRFNINTGYSITNNNNYIVPITFSTASNPDFTNTKPTHIIRDAITTIQRGSIGDEWVIFNKQQTGFYRVNYDDYTWDLIVLQLRGPGRTQIHEYNRAQIVNDVFQFARSGLMTHSRAFTILSFLSNETEYAPWLAAITGFNWIRNRLAGSPNQLAQLHALIISWSTTVIGQLTYYPRAQDTWMDSLFRRHLATHLCAIGAPACRAAAVSQLSALQLSGTPVPVDSRMWVYCNGLREGTAANFNFLWTRFQTHNVYTEKILLLQTLGCTPDQASLNTFLNAIVQENYLIRPQDYTTAFNGAVTGNEQNTAYAFTFIQNNLNQVSAAFSGSPATPLSYVSARLRTPAQINEFQTWANNSQAALGNAYNAVYNGAQNSVANLDWATDNQNDFSNYFSNGDEPVNTTPAATTAPVVVTTVAPPAISEPVTPVIETPSSANSAFLSTLIFVITVFINMV